MQLSNARLLSEFFFNHFSHLDFKTIFMQIKTANGGNKNLPELQYRCHQDFSTGAEHTTLAELLVRTKVRGDEEEPPIAAPCFLIISVIEDWNLPLNFITPNPLQRRLMT